MKRYLHEMLNDLASEDSISFHYPGHKGKFSNVHWNNLLKIDTTEMIGTDNLQNPSGVIKKSLKEASKVFGTKSTFYCVNGSTASIYAAIAATTSEGNEVLVQRNCHKSVYNAIILNRLLPRYIYPYYNEKYNLFTGIDLVQLEKLLVENPKIKVVILTNPNYFGVSLKIKEVVEIVHKYGKILVVDEAHGAHLYFSGENSALRAGADLVIHSTHKTFPSLTSTSLLHVQGDKVSVPLVRQALNMYTTTSPSYLFMLSNESAIAYMEEFGRKKLDENKKIILEMANRLNALNNINIFMGDSEDRTIGSMDFSKILISICGKTGQELLEELYYKFNIRLEMGDFFHALAVSTVMDEACDFEKLERALAEIASESLEENRIPVKYRQIFPKISLLPHIAIKSSCEVVSLNDSIGRICGTSIIPYPPGIPIINYGEVISEDIVNLILDYVSSGVEVMGIKEDLYIDVIRSEK